MHSWRNLGAVVVLPYRGLVWSMKEQGRPFLGGADSALGFLEIGIKEPVRISWRQAAHRVTNPSLQGARQEVGADE